MAKPQRAKPYRPHYTRAGRHCSGPACGRQGLIALAWAADEGTYYLADHCCPLCREHYDKTEEDDSARRLERRRLELLKLSALPPRLYGARFDGATLPKPGEGWRDFRRRVHAAGALGITDWNGHAAAALRDWSVEEGGLHLWGPPGGGKTTLTACVVNARAGVGEGSGWMTERDIYRRVLADRAIAHELTTCRLLVIDDLGAPRSIRPFQADILEEVINGLINNGGTLISTSNTPLKAQAPRWLNRYGGRVYDRLRELSPVEMAIRGYSWRTGEPHTTRRGDKE